MSSRMKVYGFLGLMLVLGPGGYFLNQKYPLFNKSAKAASKSPASEQKKGATEVTPVELAPAVRGSISSFISSTGNLRALREVAVATQADGIVRSVLVEEGDQVKEGQLLCLLDDADLKIRLELANEKLAQAKLQLEKARIRREKTVVQIANTRTEFERYQKAHKEGLVSEQEVAQHKYRLDEFQHDERVSSSEAKEFTHRVAELEAEIAQTTLEISRKKVIAPFGGFITRRSVELGQRVRSLDPLFNLGAFSTLYADVFLSERDARLAHPKQHAVIRLGAEGGVEISGEVERVSPIVDYSTGTVKVTVVLHPNDAAFRPGAFVRVDIRTATRQDATLIPKRAVLEEDGEHFVYLANGDTAKKSKITLGYEHDGRVEIRQGVAPGEKVVVAGQGALKEGTKIKVVG